MWRRAVPFILLILPMVEPAMAATWPHARTGFTIGFDVGYGSGKGNFRENVGGERQSGTVGNFRLGYVIDSLVMVGWENSLWVRRFEFPNTGRDVTWRLYNCMAGLTVYPGRSGFFIRAAVGLAAARVETVSLIVGRSFETTAETITGLGASAGLGFEWRLGRHFALGAEFDYSYQDLGDQRVGNFTLESTDIYTLVSGLNWYW